MARGGAQGDGEAVAALPDSQRVATDARQLRYRSDRILGRVPAHGHGPPRRVELQRGPEGGPHEAARLDISSLREIFSDALQDGGFQIPDSGFQIPDRSTETG